MEKISDRKIMAGGAVLFDFLGCKLNRYDIELMRTQAEALGFKTAKKKQPADIIVVNTCCVTNKAARSSRALIRQYRRNYEDAYLVVTGCYSQIEQDEVRELGVDLLVPNNEKEEFYRFLQGEIAPDSPFEEIPLVMDSARLQSRPFLKIQDGCNHFCSYCIIPFARGNPRSVGKEQVISQVEQLAPHFPELNICGLNIGLYKDGEGYTLLELLKELEAVQSLGTMRIASIEPLTVTPELLQFLITSKKICRHLHVPLQGGADVLLKSMKRRYSMAEYESLVNQIKEQDSSICIGADVITGFPGESDEIFEQVYENLKRLPLDYFHVFTFSPRAGTVAEKMEDQVPGEVKKERTTKLCELSDLKMKQFAESQFGVPTTAVVERGHFDGERYHALSNNNIPLVIYSKQADLALQNLKVIPVRWEKERVVAEIAD
jgi:threonylcarbamoyladenosine tRNA methylthiotransferase MtaB